MTITVKSTRPETTEPAAPHPYRFSTEPKTSRWPLAFAALLAGIALYIKPMLPGWSSKAEAEALPENRADDAGEQPGQGGAALALQAAADQTQADGSDGSPPAIGSPPGSGDRLVDLQSPASFETIWAPSSSSSTTRPSAR
ncbi:hypothetical protein GCM10023067_47940 [Aminobacter aganoensis]|uniref:hypothetical protein n=1 Tax=Aminobacter aganoensis TaxID=83264 RepID=UPI0031EA4D32